MRIPERLKRIATPFGQFADGFLYFFRGFGFLSKHSELWPYAVLPFVINMVIVTVAAGALLYFFPEITGLVLAPPNAWYGWFWYVPFLLLYFLAIGFFMYFLFFMILPGIVAPPFKGKLCRYTRQILKGAELNPVGGLYVDVIEPTLIELRKAVRLLAITLLLLPMNLIPVAGQIVYGVFVTYFTWMAFALNYLEYPIDSESFHTPLGRKRAYIRARRWPALGFGCAISLLYLIPVVNFFCIPVGVVGAALLYQAYGEMEGVDAAPAKRQGRNPRT
jgi:CysZ protein